MRAIALLFTLACGCKTPAPAGERPTPAADQAVLGGDRPARLHLATARARPLVIALHGYGDRGERFLDYLGYGELARREGFSVIAPDGSPDRGGLRFWNAGDACCNFHGATVDDVAYLGGLIREALRRFPAAIDPRRVVAIGLSNGGFMAYRLACEGVPLAAIVSIAGAAPRDELRCAPSGRVGLLHVHPSSDRTVLYDGGEDLLGLGGKRYPGARASALRWASLLRCTRRLEPAGELDLVPGLTGAETSVERAACPAGVDLRLWTVRGAPHVPDFGPAFARESWAWLAARRRGSEQP